MLTSGITEEDGTGVISQMPVSGSAMSTRTPGMAAPSLCAALRHRLINEKPAGGEEALSIRFNPGLC